MGKERNVFENKNILQFLNYTSKKEKIKDEDLPLIKGKIILRETGIDFRIDIINSFIEKILAQLNDII